MGERPLTYAEVANGRKTATRRLQPASQMQNNKLESGESTTKHLETIKVEAITLDKNDSETVQITTEHRSDPEPVYITTAQESGLESVEALTEQESDPENNWWAERPWNPVLIPRLAVATPPSPRFTRPWISSTQPLTYPEEMEAASAEKVDTKPWCPDDTMGMETLDGGWDPFLVDDVDDPHAPSNSHSAYMATSQGSVKGSSKPAFEGDKNMDQFTTSSPTVHNTPTIKMEASLVGDVKASLTKNNASEPFESSTESTEPQPAGSEQMLTNGNAPSKTEQGDLPARADEGKVNGLVTEENSSNAKDLNAAAENLTSISADDSTPGDKKKRKEFDLKEAMLRALDQGDTHLWDNNVGWDVLILCRGHTWRVHRSILCEQSPEWMAKYIPPKLPNKVPVAWKLDSHDPKLLGNALQFMYLQKFEHGEMDPDFPYETGCIVTNVAMYIAGTSVRCRSMMDLAIDNLEDACAIIEKAAPQLIHIDVESFQEPVRRALLIMYEQPDQWVMRGLRLAMARLVGTFYGFLTLNPRWAACYEADWKVVHRFIMEDNMYFGQGGCLRSVPAVQRQLLSALAIQVYNRADAAAITASAGGRGNTRVTYVPSSAPMQILPPAYTLNTASCPAGADDKASSSKPSTV